MTPQRVYPVPQQIALRSAPGQDTVDGFDGRGEVVLGMRSRHDRIACATVLHDLCEGFSREIARCVEVVLTRSAVWGGLRCPVELEAVLRLAHPRGVRPYLFGLPLELAVERGGNQL